MARKATGQIIERDGKNGRTYALRFRAYGKRRFITTEATSRTEAELELSHVLADVQRGIWQPRSPEPEAPATAEEPDFHVYSSEWVARREYEVDTRTAEHWRWALSCHLLPFFQVVPTLRDHRAARRCLQVGEAERAGGGGGRTR
jgi:hypothetical protein